MNSTTALIALCVLSINMQNYTMNPDGNHAHLAALAQTLLTTRYHNNARTLIPQSQDARVQSAQLSTQPSISYSSYRRPQQFTHTHRAERAQTFPATPASTPTNASLNLANREEWPALPCPTNLSSNEEWPILPSNNPQAVAIQPVQPSPLASVASAANRPKRQPKKFTFAPIATSSQK